MGTRARLTFDVGRLGPRARFFLLLVPRLLARRFTATRLAGYAFELHRSGSRCLGEWCWRHAVEAAARRDEPDVRLLIELCDRNGRLDAAEALVAEWFEHTGVVPSIGLELVARLAARGRFEAAHRVFDSLLRHCGDALAEQLPAPEWPNPPEARRIASKLRDCALAEEAGATLEKRGGSEATSDALHCELATLCFSFGAFSASAALFERASRHAPLGAEERIAHCYAIWRSAHQDAHSRLVEACASLIGRIDASPDWQLLRAAVLAAAGAGEAAAVAMESALGRNLADHPERASVIADCRAMLATLAGLRRTVRLDRHAPRAPDPEARDAIRKLFVCGYGWSGSGALYDALLELDGLGEMPSVPAGRFVNEHTDREMTFLQCAGGLGAIWRKARDEGTLLQRDLLELFRCHVAGGGAIGYSEHKCARTARHLLATFGSAYSAVFRRAIESLAGLPDDAPLSAVEHILAETTESLTAVLGRCRNGHWIVFNNAVFGHDVDMLEIFRNFRAAVVARDPLDQYADRRAHDIKHWMTPDGFAGVYRASRAAFTGNRAKLSGHKSHSVREIEFERFVREEAYRRDVLDWLLEGASARRIRQRFDPEQSEHNIGMHARLLADTERDVLNKELRRWRRS